MIDDDAAHHSPTALEISPSGVYTRAVGAPAEPGPAQARPAQARPAQARPAQGRPARVRPEPPVWMPVPTPDEQTYPLRPRGADLERRYHRRHDAAATPRDELGVLSDYVRSALASADRAGMRDPQSAAKVRAAITALREAGDTLTGRMHTWSRGS